MEVKAVIGSNYGDCGKGLITDYFCDKYRADIVVRFNGGAQAGHTVVTPEGHRHVFSHVGSGTFAGTHTFLSEFFVVNPILFSKEISFFLIFPNRPKLYIDKRCLVTTPFDMILNQMIEDNRGNSRHGSCGVGFGETIQRSLNNKFLLTFEMVSDLDSYRETLIKIRDQYFPVRCAELGLDLNSKTNLVNSQNLLENFIRDSKRLFQTAIPVNAGFLKNFNIIIFEGAQGLLLDQDFGEFPHVTRSYTGLNNVLRICEENDIKNLDVTYVTRCYLTRHGAGPLKNEQENLSFAKVIDETNIKNKYQGALRFAPLDLNLVKRSIMRDLKKAQNIKVTSGLAVTCLDQLENFAEIFYDNSLRRVSSNGRGEVAEYMNEFIGLEKPVIKSHGPTRETITEDSL